MTAQLTSRLFNVLTAVIVKMACTNKMMHTSELLNYYLTMNMNNICRICLEKSGKLTPIFDPVKPPHFSVLIMACTAVQVQEGDGLPPYICQKCISRLNIAFQFKTQCEASDTKLRQCFDNYDLQQTPDFTGYQAKERYISGTSEVVSKEPGGAENKQTQIGNGQYIGDLGSDQSMFPQCQDHEVKYKILPSNIAQTEDQPLLDDSETKHQMEEYKIELEEHYGKNINSTTVKLEDLNIQSITENTGVVKKGRRMVKVHQCNTCSKIFRTKPSLVHHIRIHTGERPYVCHLCQKRFVNGGHLHTHMKTHTGEKNHICAACNKGFATAQQLTKHTIAIHTSERPYGCTYCPKRFASSSNLNTHIKIHTGEKNFHCEICGKTFSTKGQLQQHLLVHTGEKAFLCEYCNKRFSQKAHLIRHLRIHNRTE